MKNQPMHVRGKEDYELLFPPEERILEESLRREAERNSHQENVMNRVVYDSVDSNPFNPVLPSLNASLRPPRITNFRPSTLRRATTISHWSLSRDLSQGI